MTPSSSGWPSCWTPCRDWVALALALSSRAAPRSEPQAWSLPKRWVRTPGSHHHRQCVARPGPGWPTGPDIIDSPSCCPGGRQGLCLEWGPGWDQSLAIPRPGWGWGGARAWLCCGLAWHPVAWGCLRARGDHCAALSPWMSVSSLSRGLTRTGWDRSPHLSGAWVA